MNVHAELAANIKLLARALKQGDDEDVLVKRLEAVSGSIVRLFDGATEQILDAAQQRSAIQIRGAVAASLVGGLVAIGSPPPRLSDYPIEDLLGEIARRKNAPQPKP